MKEVINIFFEMPKGDEEPYIIISKYFKGILLVGYTLISKLRNAIRKFS